MDAAQANGGSVSPPISRDALVDLIAAGLRGTYHCGRVWEAWSVGTMREDDFSPVDESDTPGEIADAVLAALAAQDVDRPAEPWNGLKGLPTLRSVIGLLRETGRYVDEEGEATDSLNDLVAWVEKQAAGNLVPGQMHCARCKFQLTRTVLYMGNGAVGAGDSKTEPCPNGCGPLWPVTWEQAARDAWAAGEALFERAKKAEDALASVSPPRLVTAEPVPNRCDGNHGGPRCNDPSCWNDDAPLETGEGDAR